MNMNTQIVKYDFGKGFAAHKVNIPPYKSKFSLYFSEGGVLADCERIDSRGVSYAVDSYCPMYEAIQSKAKTLAITYAKEQLK